jgi:glucose-1-phosphate cytidylyltransferase
MVRIGTRPILWHIMRYYAAFGHKDFILCLGYRADVVKRYFLDYAETVSNDFVLSDGGRHVELLSTDVDGWRITFADTGLHANIGQRLMAVRDHLAGEETFLATYGDCLTDAPLDELVREFSLRRATAAFLAVRPAYPPHLIRHGENGLVGAIDGPASAGLVVNGGYFVLRQQIFDVMEEGDELVVEPFRRLVEREQLIAFPHTGFWAPMDTLRERQALDVLAEGGTPPWALWQRQGLALAAVPG